MELVEFRNILAGVDPEPLDLTNERQAKQLVETADVLRKLYPDQQALNNIERELLSHRDQLPLFVQVAVKLARSKQLVADMDGRHHISVVFAVYKERTRIQTCEESPHGENFLIRKIAQLQWLFQLNDGFSWDMTLVDDGDPEQTGQLAEQILAENYSGDNVSILYLEDAIKQKLEVTGPMTSTTQSQKGGAIALGMWDVVQRQHPNHVVIYTDADLSTHLGQIGLLLDGIVNGGCDAAIGSRRDEQSIVVKRGVRNVRGKLFIYLWKRLIPTLGYIVDTQCGFKAFTDETVRAVVGDLIEKKFAFDIELLLKTELRRADSIAKIPIAWIDSEAASTTTDLQPYLAMLKAVAAMYRKYLSPNPDSDSFATFVDSLDDSQWCRMVENVPIEIANRDPLTFGSWNGVSVADLQRALCT